MRQQQEMRFTQGYAMRVWNFMSKPFQITKVLELLYMLDWIWLAILSLLPDKYVVGTLFDALRTFSTPSVIRTILCSIALIHIIGLFYNQVILRKLSLLFNVTVLLYITVYSFQRVSAAAAGLGYYMILIGITVFAFWRMDDGS